MGPPDFLQLTERCGGGDTHRSGAGCNVQWGRVSGAVDPKENMGELLGFLWVGP